MHACRLIILLGLSSSLGIGASDWVNGGQVEQKAVAEELDWHSAIWHSVVSHNLELDSGWRRTDDGWLQTADWTVSSSRTEQTLATQLHPSLIALFVVLVSTGALLAFEPEIRRPRKHLLKSDDTLIRDWVQRLG